MKTIGLIGGLSWESSAEYYRIINQSVQKALGGVHSAKIIELSFNFQEVEELQRAGKWDALTTMMVNAGQRLKLAGADFILICSNTMHKMADDVEKAVGLPLLHIADPTGEAVLASNIKTIGLLGTAFTMEQAFYKDRLTKKFGLNVVIPDDEGRAVVHSTIYNELVKGVITDTSREKFRHVIKGLVGKGAQGVILGCTEIMLLVKQEDSPVPVFDTTTLHARRAAQMAIELG